MLAQKLPVGTNNKVEAMALLLGLELALQLNIVNIHIEGDSSVVINSCVKKKIENWKFGYVLEKAWAIIDKFKVVSFSHTLREGNQVADNLSNIGCDLKTNEVRIPEFISANFPTLFTLIHQEKTF
jgi:ribonuclease HI